MTLKPALTLLSLSAALLLGACGKKPVPPKEDAPAAVVQPAATAPTPVAHATVDPTEQDEKKAKLEYATMEDGYINDAHGQWAASAKASSSFGEEGDRAPKTPQESLAWNAVGKPNGNDWSNNQQDVGFDWLELGYEKPVSATEVRIVSRSDHAVEALNKVELIDADGGVHTVWAGLNDQKQDKRGSRTWIVRKLDAPTAYKVRGVKITFANNVSSGYKNIDAVQLIGD
jgi:hypothetical protein